MAGGFGHDADGGRLRAHRRGRRRRLERFGPHVVDRPAPSAGDRLRDAGQWRKADLRFDRDAGWSGSGIARRDRLDGHDPRRRPRSCDRPTPGKSACSRSTRRCCRGCDERVDGRAMAGRWRPPRRCPASVRLHGPRDARRGLRRCCGLHVDAARPAVEWARRNAARTDSRAPDPLARRRRSRLRRSRGPQGPAL